jgi:hypothetical protein
MIRRACSESRRRNRAKYGLSHWEVEIRKPPRNQQYIDRPLIHHLIRERDIAVPRVLGLGDVHSRIFASGGRETGTERTTEHPLPHHMTGVKDD